MGGQQTSAARPGLWQEMMDKYNRAIQPRPESIMAPKESWSDWALRQGARGIDLGVQAEQDPSKLIDWATAPVMEKLDKPVRAGAKQVLGKYGDPVATGLEVAIPALSYASGLMEENPAFWQEAGEEPATAPTSELSTDPMTHSLGNDRVAIRHADGSISKGIGGENYDELIERQRSAIAHTFRHSPELQKKFDADMLSPQNEFGYVDEYGNFYRGKNAPTAPLGGTVESVPRESLSEQAFHGTYPDRMQAIRQQGMRAGWFSKGGGDTGALSQYLEGKGENPVVVADPKDLPPEIAGADPNADYIIPNWSGQQTMENPYLGPQEFGNVPPQTGPVVPGSRLRELLGMDPRDPEKVLLRPVAPERQTGPLNIGGTGRLTSRPTQGREWPQSMQELTAPSTQYLAGDPFGRGTAELTEGVPGLKRPTYTGPLPELGGDLPERFHGSSEPIQMMMNPQEGSYGGHLYGAGLYTTDNYNVAGGYAQHEGPIYSIHEIRPVKMFNVENPLPPSVAIDMYDNTLDDHWLSFMSAEDRAPYLEDYQTVHGKEYEPEHFGMGVLYPRNPGGGVLPGSRIIQGHEPLPIGYWYDNIRQRLGENVAAEQEQMLRGTLSREGYGGFEHVGGRRSGFVDHTVKIYWNPKDDIRMRHLHSGFGSPEGEYVPSGLEPQAEYRQPAPEVPPPYLGRRRQPLPGSYYPEQFSWDERVSPMNTSDLYDREALQPEPGYHYSGVDLADVRDIQEEGLGKDFIWTKRPMETGLGQWADALIRTHQGAGEWELSDPLQPFQLTDIGPEKIEIRTRHGWKPIKSMQLPRGGY